MPEMPETFDHDDERAFAPGEAGSSTTGLERFPWPGSDKEVAAANARIRAAAQPKALHFEIRPAR